MISNPIREMTRDDFSVGQTVYLKTVVCGGNFWTKEKIVEATVVKVGRKLLTVALRNSSGWKYQFYIDECFRQKAEYSVEYELFISKQDILDYWQSEYLIHAIRDKLEKRYNYNKYHKDITLQSLKNVAETLGIPVEPMSDVSILRS